MSWLKLDDHMSDDPKFLALEEDYETGLAVYIAGLCFCGAHLTDGVIPKIKAHRLTPSAERLAPRLVEVGLWHDGGTMYAVNNYLHYNPSREWSKANLRKGAERSRRHRDKVSNGVSNAHPVPVTVPVTETEDHKTTWPSLSDGHAGVEKDSLFEEFWKHYPRKVKKDRAQKAWVKARETIDPRAIISILKDYPFNTDDMRFVPHPASWLDAERWLDEFD